MRHKVFRDENQPRVVRALQSDGNKVIDLAAIGSSCPDLMVARGRLCVLMEVKMPKGQVYIAQLEFLAKWPGYAGLVETGDQAVAMMHDPDAYCLKEHERQIVLDICAEWREKSKVDLKPRIRIMEFEKQMKQRLAVLGVER